MSIEKSDYCPSPVDEKANEFLSLSLNEKLRYLCESYGPDTILDELVKANADFVEEVLDAIVVEDAGELFDE